MNTITEDFFIERPASVSTSYEFAAESFTKAAALLPYFDAANNERLVGLIKMQLLVI